ncbi:hypothetical protein KUCAC02_025586, partial [Chaenocephalus aceratus]
ISPSCSKCDRLALDRLQSVSDARVLLLRAEAAILCGLDNRLHALIKQVLLTKPGGSDVLKEYEEKGTISPATRKVMVNILVADMVQSEGFSKILFSLLFGSETRSKLLEQWPTSFKAKVIQQAEMLTSTPLLKRLLLSAKNQRADEPSLESPGGKELQPELYLALLLPRPSFYTPYIPHPKNPGKHKHPSLHVKLDKDLCRLAGLRRMGCLSPRGAEGKHGDLTVEE